MAYALEVINGKPYICKCGNRVEQEKEFAAWLLKDPALPQYPPRAREADWCLEVVGTGLPEAIGRVYSASVFSEALPDLIYLLIALDVADEVPKGHMIPRCHWNQLDALVAGWLRPYESDGIVVPALSRDIIDLIKRGQPYSRPCYQHGDLSPWHILRHNGQSYCIDAEHASSYYPAYFDLAYLYVLLAAQCGDEEMSSRLLRQFISACSERAFAWPLFWALVARCAAGNLEWAQAEQNEKYLQACMKIL